MTKVTVYKFKVWSQAAGDYLMSFRMATEKGVEMMGGEIIPGTGVEIDANRLHGQEWTEPGFVP